MQIDIFVQNVKKYCELKGVKPTTACAESGAGKSLLSEVSSRGRIPSIERVQLLAQYLGVTTSDLLGEAQKSSPPSEEDGLPPIWYSLSEEQKRATVDYMNYLASRREKP